MTEDSRSGITPETAVEKILSGAELTEREVRVEGLRPTDRYVAVRARKLICLKASKRRKTPLFKRTVEFFMGKS